MSENRQRYLIVHGHFYQPPRQNPWLDQMAPEPSAAPFHDWNARIVRECYGPNGFARIVDDKNRIVTMVNNYARLSFNFGPTLVRWLERHDTETLAAVVEGDRISRAATGFGNALAHPFDHVIMPLASRRDKNTLVRWGIEDFSRLYGRAPQGMWLPETAVDIETLEVLADHGIEFTVLAPRQAARIRPMGTPTWCEVNSSTFDTSRPYVQRLSGGRSIAIFFFHGPLSHNIAFEEGLKSATGLLEKIGDEFEKLKGDGPGLVAISTDGETFGHHFKFGDMGLAALFHMADSLNSFEVTNFSAFLKKHPPVFEVEIAENTAWSCAHGVDRWKDDCGCRLGGPDNHQRWRAPLRSGLNRLADKIDGLYLDTVAPLVEDPWAARDAYIDVVLDDSDGARERFVSKVSGKSLAEDERKTLLRALEMERSRLAMFTSCGWFFDEVSGLETALILTFAARAIDLAEMLGLSLEDDFIDDLADAPSNRKKYRDGRGVYLKKVAPLKPDDAAIAAAWALRRLLVLGFSAPSFRIEESTRTVERSGTSILGGRVDVVFHRILKKSRHLVLVALPEGEELVLMVKELVPGEDVEALSHRVLELVSEADLTLALKHFESLRGARTVNLKSLPPAALPGLLNTKSRPTQERLYDLVPAFRLGPGHAAELFKLDPGAPKWLKRFYGLLLDFRLSHELAGPCSRGEPEECLWLIKVMKELGHTPDRDLAGHAIIKALKGFIRRPWDASAHAVEALFEVAEATGADLDLWPIENLFFKTHLAGGPKGLGKDELDVIHRLGKHLGFTDEILAGLS